MATTNHGSIEFLRFPNPSYPGDNTKLIKKWLRDSWARRKIALLQSINNASILRTVSVITPQLINGNHYESYGNTYYYKIGCRVHVHVGVRDLTAGTTYSLWTMPAGYRPMSLASAVGIGGNISTISRLRISTAGLVQVNTDHTAAGIDLEYDAFT